MIQIGEKSTQTISVSEYVEKNSPITNQGRTVKYNDKDYLILSLMDGGELWCSAPLSSKILSGESINIAQDCKILRNISDGKVYDYLVSKGKVNVFNNLTM